MARTFHAVRNEHHTGRGEHVTRERFDAQAADLAAERAEMREAEHHAEIIRHEARGLAEVTR